MLTVYRAWKNPDQVEGRGHHVSIGLFTRRSDAEIALSLAVYGKRPDEIAVVPHNPNGLYRSTDDLLGIEEIKLFSDLDEWQNNRREVARESARMKLTLDEINVLGL